MGQWRFRFRVRAPTGTPRSIRLVRPRWAKWNDGVSVPYRGIAFQRVGAVPLDPIDHHVPDPYATKLRSRSHALNGHRIPAQGANPGDPPGKRNTRSEGTPHSLRVSDIDHGLSYAVFLQNISLV